MDHISGAGALFFDDQGRVLLVEPTYKPHWEIPGGVVEPGETPSEACHREVLEELGIDRPPGRLLVIDWAPVEDQIRTLFVFDGQGQLDAHEIHLQAEELKSFEFVEPQEAATRLIPRLARRVDAALHARTTGETVYLEHGIAFVPRNSAQNGISQS